MEKYTLSFILFLAAIVASSLGDDLHYRDLFLVLSLLVYAVLLSVFNYELYVSFLIRKNRLNGEILNKIKKTWGWVCLIIPIHIWVNTKKTDEEGDELAFCARCHVAKKIKEIK